MLLTNITANILEFKSVVHWLNDNESYVTAEIKANVSNPVLLSESALIETFQTDKISWAEFFFVIIEVLQSPEKVTSVVDMKVGEVSKAFTWWFGLSGIGYYLD